MTLHLTTHRMDWKLLFLNFNQTLNSKLQNHIQNWSFENSNLIIQLPESLLHIVDMEKIAEHEPTSTRRHSPWYDS